MRNIKKLLGIVLAMCVVLSAFTCLMGVNIFAEEAPAKTQEYKVSTYENVAAAKADGIEQVGAEIGKNAMGYSFTSTDDFAKGTQVIKMGANGLFAGVFTFPHKQNAELYKNIGISGKINIWSISTRKGTTFWTGKERSVTTEDDGTVTDKTVYYGVGVDIHYSKQSDGTYLPAMNQQLRIFRVTKKTASDGAVTTTYTSDDVGDYNLKTISAADMAKDVFPNDTTKQAEWIESVRQDSAVSIPKADRFIPFNYYIKNNKPYLDLTLTLGDITFTTTQLIDQARVHNGFMGIGNCSYQYHDGVYLTIGDITATYDISPYYNEQVTDFFNNQTLYKDYLNKDLLKNTNSIIETINNHESANAVMNAVTELENSVSAISDSDLKDRILNNEQYDEALLKALKIRCNIFLKSEFVYDSAASKYLTDSTGYIIGGYVENYTPVSYELSLTYKDWFSNIYSKTYGLDSNTFILKSCDRWVTNYGVKNYYENNITYKVSSSYDPSAASNSKFYTMSFEGNPTYLNGQWLNSSADLTKIAIGTNTDGTNNVYGVFTQKMDIIKSNGIYYFKNGYVVDTLGTTYGPTSNSIPLAYPAKVNNYKFVIGATASSVSNNNFKLTYDFSDIEAANFETYFAENNNFGKKFTAEDTAKINAILTEYNKLPELALEKLSDSTKKTIAELQKAATELNSGVSLFYNFENTDAATDFKAEAKVTDESTGYKDTLTETNIYSEDAAKNAPTGNEAFWGVHTDTSTNNCLWLRKSFAAPNGSNSVNMVPTSNDNQLKSSVRYTLKDGVIPNGKRVQKVSFKLYMGVGYCWDGYKQYAGIVLDSAGEYDYNIYGINNNGEPSAKHRYPQENGAYSDIANGIVLTEIVGDGTESKPAYGNFPKVKGGTETVERYIPFGVKECDFGGTGGAYRGFTTASQWLNVTIEYNTEKGYYTMVINGTHIGSDNAKHETTRYYDLPKVTKMAKNLSFTTFNATSRTIDDLAITLVDNNCEHNWSEWTTITPVTCTTDGSKTRTCSLCGEEETETIIHQGHKYSDTVVPPTCTTDGYTEHVCSACGDNFKDNYTDAKHTPNEEWTVITAPSVGADGESKLYCSVCNEVLETKVTKFTGFHADGTKTYYYEEGTMVTGWKTVNGKQYYFKQSTGVMFKNCQALIEGSTYIFGSDGAVVTAPTLSIINDKCYKEGKYQVKGWQTVNGAKYYFGGENGTMLKDQITMIYENVYKFDESGKLVTDTLTIKGRKCYDAEGNMKTGWQTVYGEQFFFRASGTYTGYMIHGTKALINGQTYVFGANGVAKADLTATAKSYTSAAGKNGLTVTATRYLPVENVSQVVAYGVLVTKQETLNTNEVTYSNGTLSAPTGVAKAVKNSGISYVAGSFTQNITASSGSNIKYCGFAVYTDNSGNQVIKFSDVQNFIVE